MLRRLQDEESLRELIARVVEDGKSYAKAEVALVKQTALSKVDAVKPATILFVCALLLVQAALTVLAAALGMTLALWIGTPGGLAVGGVVVLALAGLLGWLGASRLRGAK